MGKFLSTKGWKSLLANKDCKALKAPDLEKLIVQFEAAEKKADANAADASFSKIKIKFRDLKKANAKNRTLIKWMDQATEEAEALAASLAAEDEGGAEGAGAPAEKPAEKPEEAAAPVEKKQAKDERAEAKPEKPEAKAAEKKDADAPPSKEDAQRAKLSETLANELTLARRRTKDKASKFVLNVDAKAPGLMLTRKDLTPNILKAAVFLTGKKGKTLKGLCYGESGKWVFVLANEPSDTLIRLLKKAALVHAGMKLKLKVIGGGVELDDGEAADPEDAAEDAPAAEAAEAKPEGAADDGATLIRAATKSRKIWIKTKDGVDTLIGRLVAHLKDNEDPELVEIAGAMEAMAEKGLPGVSEGAQAALVAGLMDLEQGGAPDAARDKVLGAVAAYRQGLEANTFVDLCEENPFKVKVPIRPMMGRALDEIEKTLAAN